MLQIHNLLFNGNFSSLSCCLFFSTLMTYFHEWDLLIQDRKQFIYFLKYICVSFLQYWQDKMGVSFFWVYARFILS